MRKLKSFIKYCMWKTAYLLPNYPAHQYIYKYFEFIRQAIWKYLFAQIGTNTYIRSKAKISGYYNIKLGSNSIIGPESIINATDKIYIGDYFLSGPELIIYTAEHGTEPLPIPFIRQSNTSAPVNIGENVYIGARVTILKGVTIGSNVIIATGSVVVKDIPSGELWGGVPAKKIKTL